MNFALLGCDATVLPLVRAIAADTRHRLHVAAMVPTSQGSSETFGMLAELLAIAPGVRIESQWEGLPHDAGIDAVIAVVGSETVDECVKQTAAAGKPVLLVPNGDPASALAYELTLVRDDAHVPLVPYFPLRFSGPLRAAVRSLRTGELRDPLNFQWSRCVVPSDPVGRFSKPSGRIGNPSYGDGRPTLLSARDVHRALVHDADLLRQLGGNYSQVTAVRSGDADAGFSMVTVTLAGSGLPTATWIARPADDRPSFELAIPTSAGTVSLRGRTAAGEIATGDAAAVEVSGTHAAVEKLRTGAEEDAAMAMLRHFDSAVSGNETPPVWPDLLRATEIVEAAERSVRRRRTIDLHFETTSERSQFKTQMTAIGCGLMTMTLVSFVFLLIAGALFNMHPAVMQVARVGIFVPLVLFLLLQVLLFISRPSKVDEETGRIRDKG